MFDSATTLSEEASASSPGLSAVTDKEKKAIKIAKNL
jgi:hypothetical protein